MAFRKQPQPTAPAAPLAAIGLPGIADHPVYRGAKEALREATRRRLELDNEAAALRRVIANAIEALKDPMADVDLVAMEEAEDAIPGKELELRSARRVEIMAERELEQARAAALAEIIPAWRARDAELVARAARAMLELEEARREHERLAVVLHQAAELPSEGGDGRGGARRYLRGDIPGLRVDGELWTLKMQRAGFDLEPWPQPAKAAKSAHELHMEREAEGARRRREADMGLRRGPSTWYGTYDASRG